MANASVSDSEKTFLMFVQTDDLAMMKLELKSNPALANAKDKDGTPALHHAVMQANEDAVDLLLLKGADPRIPDERGEKADGLATRLNSRPSRRKSANLPSSSTWPTRNRICEKSSRRSSGASPPERGANCRGRKRHSTRKNAIP